MTETFNTVQNLNEVQSKVVETTEGYVRVIAGAGTGKTRTITERYIYLIEEVGISQENILCVTFTNKAAAEMRSRIIRRIGVNAGEFICTFHSLCIKILRADITRIGFPTAFTIIDEEDQKDILRQIYAEHDISKKDYPISSIINYICAQKHNTQYVRDFMALNSNQKREEFLATGNDEQWTVFSEYLRIQKKNFYLDFEDLMYFTVYLLEKFDDIRAFWQSKFDYIMVDESQDNNDTQWNLVNLLSGGHNNMMVVGDPDQCIYEWRGSIPEYLVDFDKSHTPCTTIILNENYRSTPNILDVANCVICRNVKRVPKDLFTKREPIQNVTHFHAQNDEEEAKFVASTIFELNRSGIPFNDFAILYRASHLSRAIEQGLIQAGIPYKIYAGVNFFARKEIKDIFAYLKVINSFDDTSTIRVINVPARKLGKAYLLKLLEKFKHGNNSIIETILDHKDDKDIGKKSAVEFARMILSLHNEASSLKLSDLVQRVLEESGLIEMYSETDQEERLNNIAELEQMIQQYEHEHEKWDLPLFLQEMALYTNMDLKNNSDQVKLMTIHQAKGLEFPVVFTIGMNEGVLPSIHSLRNPFQNNLEEERRLAYVAFTRAHDYLFITEHEGYDFHNNNHFLPSRFIYEIKQELLINEGHMSKSIEEKIRSIPVVALEADQTKPKAKTTRKYHVGDEIEHRIFGTGTILEINEGKDIVTVLFEKRNEPKHLLLSKLDSIAIIKI